MRVIDQASAANGHEPLPDDLAAVAVKRCEAGVQCGTLEN
jgi:hypothetical protein